jgi:hypothetical protein
MTAVIDDLTALYDQMDTVTFEDSSPDLAAVLTVGTCAFVAPGRPSWSFSSTSSGMKLLR